MEYHAAMSALHVALTEAGWQVAILRVHPDADTITKLQKLASIRRLMAAAQGAADSIEADLYKRLGAELAEADLQEGEPG